VDLVERDADGRLVVVDLKTAARKYSDLQVEASLQLSIYSYATAMNGLADEAELRLRFDVLTKTKTPELHRTGRPVTGRRTSASTGWPRRSSPRSTPACSRPAWAGTARIARCGATAGRGSSFGVGQPG
jgi:PD-(D/E)XK nuclease superfamily